MRRRTFLKVAGISTVGVIAAGGGAAYYSRSIEPSWVDITSVPLYMPRLSPAFDGYRVVQISDIHADEEWMFPDRLQPIIHAVNELHPDLILITGDFVTYEGDYPLNTVSALASLSAHDGIFAVLGNHDHWSGADEVRAVLKTTDIQELPNKVHTIARKGAMLHIVGLDDLWPYSSRTLSVWSYEPLLHDVIRTMPQQGAAILLVHEPDFADVAARSNRFDLQLSGHTHGGQVRIPFVGAVELPPLGRKYSSGLYQFSSMQLYTNRGLGMVHPMVRFNCRPEITLFTCHPMT